MLCPVSPDTSDDPFSDLWEANARFAADFTQQGLTGIAARDLTVVTCMDTRIDPLAVLGLAPGDAKIIRSAGARATDELLRSVVLAVHLLGGGRILLMPHTRCGLVGTDDQVRAKVASATGRDVDDPEVASFEPHAITDQADMVRRDAARIRAHPLLGPSVRVAAALYDVDTGHLSPFAI
jgi:carbonic anhydrase